MVGVNGCYTGAQTPTDEKRGHFSEKRCQCQINVAKTRILQKKFNLPGGWACMDDPENLARILCQVFARLSLTTVSCIKISRENPAYYGGY